MLVHRYGGELAYGPHSINLVGPSVENYTSDSTSPIDFRLWVTDIAGQNVTAGQTFCHCANDDMSSSCQRLATRIPSTLHSVGACHAHQSPVWG